MPQAQWPLAFGRPRVEIFLRRAADGQLLLRSLLADTGAGSTTSQFDLILDEEDCLKCGGRPGVYVSLGGAYFGSFLVYNISVQIPTIGFDERLRSVGVTSVPANTNGIACFSFLNRFTYGNFGDPGQFGLEN